jgi:hypothetical protein
VRALAPNFSLSGRIQEAAECRVAGDSSPGSLKVWRFKWQSGGSQIGLGTNSISRMLFVDYTQYTNSRLVPTVAE